MITTFTHSDKRTDQLLLTHDHTNHDQASGQPMDCRLGKHLAREPKKDGAWRVQLRVPSGNVGCHVLVKAAQHHDRGRGVQHVEHRDEKLIVHRLHVGITEQWC